MDCWGNLVTQPKVTALEQARQLSYIKYTAPPQGPSSGLEPERTVITSESRGLILSGGTTGNRTWEAALHLGSFLASPAGEALVRGKRVIELGAGTGFLSLFCARHLGAKGVVVSDREPALIENIRGCVPFNQNGPDTDPIPIYPAVWEWGTPLQRTEEMDVFVADDKLKFDVALGADLVGRSFICLHSFTDVFQIYDADLVPLLLSTVRDLFENYTVEQFIIAATLRNEATFKTFLTGCGKSRIFFEENLLCVSRNQSSQSKKQTTSKSRPSPLSQHRQTTKQASSTRRAFRFGHTGSCGADQVAIRVPEKQLS